MKTKSVSNNYYVRYAITKSDFKGDREREFRVFKTGPIPALNAFHHAMQKEREVDGKRKVIRPKLLADEYKILRLFLRYSEGTDLSRGRTIESDFDIPNTPNPVLKVRVKRPKGEKAPKFKHPEFSFITEEVV